MEDFQLDQRLAADCFVLGKLEFSQVLLMNNPLLPWFILVPETSETEMYALADEQLVLLNDEIRLTCDFLTQEHAPEKLNVAAIGNIVRQLHVHVVARSSGDYCWPGVVWGTQWQERYEEGAVQQIARDLQQACGDRFQPAPAYC